MQTTADYSAENVCCIPKMKMNKFEVGGIDSGEQRDGAM